MILDKKYDWDLESLLAGEDLETLYSKWQNQKNHLLKLYPNFYTSLENFINWKNENLKFEKISNRLVNYISNNLNEDVVNEKWNFWSQKLSNEWNEFSIATSDSSNILLKNKKTILQYLKNDELKEYRRDYDIFFKKQKHVLSLKEEKILSSYSLIEDGYEDVFTTFVDGTIKFDSVKNKNNKEIKINSISDVTFYLKSNDRVLRKNTWYSFNEAYYKNRNLLSTLLYYNYLTLNNSCKIRNYVDYVDATCQDDEITVDLILSIYKNVENYKDLYKKFYTARDNALKKIFKLDKVEPWDKSLDLSTKQSVYSIDDAKKIAIDALSVYGQEYVDTVNKAFEEKWISWLPKENKHSGAYSIGGTLGLDKYFISMNFDKTLSSIYTLVHELGHSMHSYYFGKKQTVHCGCEIFYTEIASITNEVLLSLYLLQKEKDDKAKIKILDELITGFFATTTRQIIFSNFEYEMVQRIKNKLPITYKEIEKVYVDMNVKYTGADPKKLTSKKYVQSLSTILRISHFYVGNFYVYKYAVGQIPALISGYKIFNNDKNFINKYFSFLESGNSISPIDTIKLLGIDLYSDDPFKECQKILEELIKQYISLVKKVYK
ncbi:oligoendopeptidase F [Malacoplasma iowae]|uniref:oligoendopeptidase F n=1 Tax=Malacoplasma iowae TaxID=2116 RepID=UPI002A18806C|nr:oligoendopeptidase F [Malacoplasma iowae]WPL40316.1 oligoendopeptidase F [Malacoplasma iowae]